MNKDSLLILIYLLISVSLVAQKPYYSEENLSWDTTSVKGEIEQIIYLIGDAGGYDSTKPAALDVLEAQLNQEKEKSTVLFLGDNSYPKGLPVEDDEKRKEAESKIDKQLNPLRNYNGNVIFIPGNHDWDHWSEDGWAGIKRQEEYIKNKVQTENSFLPSLGCPGPVAVPLEKDVLLIVFDSQWWLHRWEKPRGEEDYCSINNELDFVEQLSAIIKDNSDKKIIVAAHHPMYSNGNHGGYFSAKSHIFPLTAINQKLYIPLPIIGSIYPLGRKYNPHLQDINNPRYQLLTKNLDLAFGDHKNIIYAAGHEHNLQYFLKGTQHHIISGAGCKARFAKKGKGASFNVKKQGFVKLIHLKDGAMWMEFWTVTDSMKSSGEVIFRKQIILKDSIIKQEPTINYTDSTITIVAAPTLKATKAKMFFFGEHYRSAWLAPITVNVIDLNTEKGGLTPIKLGGQGQTLSLRLRNKEGKEFLLRSIKKYPTKVLEDGLKDTWMGDVVKDQVSMAHPYGAFVIPKLAEAASIYHKNSKLVYVPDDPLLGEFRSAYGNTLALFEARASKKLSSYVNFGEAEKAISTPKLLKKLRESNDNLVDEKEVLKNRLFDMWIGDWDRHDDQWRWAQFKCRKKNFDSCYHVKNENTDKGFIFRPIPRDRDQVFVKMDGLFPWIFTRKSNMRKIKNFDYVEKDIEGLNIQGRPLDRTFLSRLTEQEWIDVATKMKNSLTDSIISDAIRQWPDTIFKLDGEEIIEKLKSRRNDLVNYAKDYYKILAKEVEIIGSDENETFEVTREENGDVLVRIYRSSKNKRKKTLFYKRLFLFSETNEIRLFGLGGEDRFEVTGYAKKSILVQIIGGEQLDHLIDYSEVKGSKKFTKVYDVTNGIIIEYGKESKDLTENDIRLNSYTRDKYKPNKVYPVYRAGFNVDDGVFLGLGVGFKNYAWRKNPYKSKHKISGAIAIRTGAFFINYDGTFFQSLGKWDINLESKVFYPRGVSNFYGLGNETTSEGDPTFYRVDFNYALFFPSLQRKIGKYDLIKIGPKYQFLDIKSNEGKFISTPEAMVPEYVFSQTHLIGLEVNYKLNSTKNLALPLNGFKWNVDGSYIYNTSNSETIANLKSDLSFFTSSKTKVRPTLALRAGGAINVGNFEFYQANTLGAQTHEMGEGNLRGFRRSRFSGRNSMYFNSELRLKLVTFRSYIFPGEFGIHGFYDIARVWFDGEVSNLWHQGYGGGLWISPFKQFAVVATYQHSNEDRFVSLHFHFIF